MVTFGGPGVMLLGALVSGVLAALLALALARRTGAVFAVAAAGFCWSLVVIALVTLVPATGAPGWVAAETRLDYCSTDIGGPAPDGFWIFDGGQRLLNTALFVPAGALGTLAACRWRSAGTLVPLLVLGLAAFSGLIEWTQLELARLDRACDLTDVIDNATGAAIGAGVGVALALVLRPWRARGD
ncbi:VanZ family protein [Nocardioides zeae]|uniref:VanZ family protein n=1 Tax=Nocardioides imazamoxiresistens TaxID=3231893 RepID=A0ABU3PVP0_9ACTN|nr:VanZ family protein [Nocardioides zeae]MDT9592815.1 VanZ family protein [Nocardioides zeae]